MGPRDNRGCGLLGFKWLRMDPPCLCASSPASNLFLQIRTIKRKLRILRNSYIRNEHIWCQNGRFTPVLGFLIFTGVKQTFINVNFQHAGLTAKNIFVFFDIP